MRIRWTVPAADDLENIKSYLQQHFPHVAEPTFGRSISGFVPLRPRRTVADPATAAAQGNCPLRRFPMLSSIPSKPKPLKFCTSITALKTGDDEDRPKLKRRPADTGDNPSTTTDPGTTSTPPNSN